MLRLQTGYIYCKSEWETKKTFTHAYVYWSMLRAAMRPLNLKWIMYYDKKGSYKKKNEYKPYVLRISKNGNLHVTVITFCSKINETMF